MSNQRIRLFVTGRVQGVFFKQHQKLWQKKIVFGWVSNVKDGRVEAIVEGEILDVKFS